jgi:hypothetical protein
MSNVRTFAEHADSGVDAPFFHTFPVWVIEALAQKGLKAAHVRVIKVMPKTAEVSFFDPQADLSVPDPATVLVAKLRRKDVFQGGVTA